ncbi:MAG: kynureninase [Bacteroidales bacterium]|jgi:kynureninase|nr:kynureninase [Bacteroidales bacterium]NLM93393.1 kynureninase [Bacteroidales bacterium]
MLKDFSVSRGYARTLDSQDSLGHFRKRFFLPENTIYLDGNSLGLLSEDAEGTLLRVLDEWKRLGIRGWLEGQRPWFFFGEQLGEMASALVGAKAGELVFSGTTTVNIHALISTFYQPSGKRSKILADELNFPSDLYALQGQIKMKGLDPDQELVLARSRDGRTLDEESIVEMMTDEVALVYLPSVLFASGQLLDMEYLTRAAHERGIPIGWDCSHSAGAVPHYFHKWGVDFATFCSYKYLNGGPGCAAFLYINKKHFDREPLMAGWFGFVKERQFDLSLQFEPAPHAGGWQISSLGVLGSSTMEGALQITLEAGIENIRQKSLMLTSYFMKLIDAGLRKAPYHFSYVNPAEAHRRGGHVALIHPSEALRINEALKARGIIPDFRPPDIIRIAPIALYNTFEELWELAKALQEIMDRQEFKRFEHSRKAIS